MYREHLGADRGMLFTFFAGAGLDVLDEEYKDPTRYYLDE